MSQQVFTGRYQIEGHIARGGMAEVYLARDLLLDRPVALKVLFPEFSADRSFVERFRREARAAANLNHPNIVSVYDWGEEAGTYFIVMEYVDGPTLRELIQRMGPLLPTRSAEIGADIAGALDFAHRGGVIHRDMKPGNVLVSNLVKVTDFGIARAATGDPQESLTQTGAVMGTASYFSPEQAQGLNIDPRSDVYSLGVVLYEMVAGRPPFVGESPVSIAYQHVREAPLPPSQHNPDVPPEFEAVVMKAMAKNRANRYASASELRDDLLRFSHGQAVTAEPLLSPQDVTGVMSDTRAQPAADGTRVMTATAARREVVVDQEPPQRTRTGAYFVVLMVLLAVLAGFLVLLARQLGIGSEAQVAVPQVVGVSEADAIRRLNDVGLKSKTMPVNDDVNPAGTVFEQNPRQGVKVDKGDVITITVSLGSMPIEVPDVRNRKVDSATNVLAERGFQVEVDEKPDDKAPANTVLDQNPKPGGQAPRGSKIVLIVSSGRGQVAVPNVVGRDQSEAANVLGQAGFTVAVQREASDTVATGRVIRTDPSAPAPLAKGSTVNLIVSSGPVPTTTTPQITLPTTPRATTTTRP